MISLDQFEAALRSRSLSDHTVRAYTRAWSQVLGRCAVEEVALEAVDASRAPGAGGRNGLAPWVPPARYK